MSFDYSTLPNNIEGTGSVFNHAFQFYEGDYTYSNAIEKIDNTHFTQQFMVRNGGDDQLTNVQVDIMYDGTTYEAKFFDFKDPSVTPVTETISTSVSSADVGSFYNLVGNEIQVQTSHRQASDPDWVVPNSDWKLQVWTRTNDIYCSSYINNENCTWETQFYYDGAITGTGIWTFPCDQNEEAAPEPVAPEPVFTAGETVQTSFSVVGEDKLDYVLPTVDDADGDVKWEIELRADKGTRLATDMIELHKFGKKHTLKFRPEKENEGITYYFAIVLKTEGADEGQKFPMEVTVEASAAPEPVFTAGETVQTSFSVAGEEKLDYVLPTVDDADGDVKWVIEIDGDKGDALADFIYLDKFGKKHTLKFRPQIQNEGNTYNFAIVLKTMGAADGEKFPMTVTITSTFDPNTLPSLKTGNKRTFEHDFRYKFGLHTAFNKVHAKDKQHFTQELRVVNDGVETKVDITYFYDGETYEVTFQDHNDKSAPAIAVSMATTVSKDDVGQWDNLVAGNAAVQVQSSHRQSNEAEWYIKNSDWKTQVWIKKNDIYFSSYISNDRKDWTTTFFYEGEELGRGTWKFGESDAFIAPDKASFLDATSLVSKFTTKGEAYSYVLPEVDDFYGELKYKIELVAHKEKDTPVPSWIKLTSVGSTYTLEFYPKLNDENKTFYFALLIKLDGESDGSYYPMEVFVESDFDPASLPFSLTNSEDLFEMDFHYSYGANLLRSTISAKTQTTFTQTISVLNNDVRTRVNIDYLYDGKTFDTSFTTPDDSSVKAREISMPTTTSTKGDGEWFNFIKGDTTNVQVQASHLQDADTRWYVSEADWKTQVYIDTDKIYVSNYIDNDTKTWTVTFFWQGEELGRGVWKFGDSRVFQIPLNYQASFATAPTKSYQATVDQASSYNLPAVEDFNGKATTELTLTDLNGLSVPSWLTLSKSQSSGVYELKMQPNRAQQGQTFYFNVVSTVVETGSQYSYQMYVSVPLAAYDANAMPSQISNSEEHFWQAFAFAPGSNYAYNSIVATSSTTFTQRMLVEVDGVQTGILAMINYDGYRYTATFVDIITDSLAVKTASMSTQVSSADVGDWHTMYEGVQVQASHRQSSDPEWYVTPSDWKLQLWIKENDIYFSSYIDNDSLTWTTTFFYKQAELGRGVWSFGKTEHYLNFEEGSAVIISGDCEDLGAKITELGTTIKILEEENASMRGSTNFWTLEEADCIGDGGLLREVECLLRQDIKAGGLVMAVGAAIAALPVMLAF